MKFFESYTLVFVASWLLFRMLRLIFIWILSTLDSSNECNNNDSLNFTYERSELVKYCSSIIASTPGNESPNMTCRKLVLSALHSHSVSKANNGGVCLLGSEHNILYVAIKLSFDWDLRDNEVVAVLLTAIYDCEKTFERIFLGAIVGITAPYFLTGWKSDFKDQKENLDAVEFFLDHARSANLVFIGSDNIYRFIDVPIESVENQASPIRVVIQLGKAKILHILLKFGAKIQNDNDINPVESILETIKVCNKMQAQNLIDCLRLILRAIPRVNFSVDKKIFKHLKLPIDYNYHRRIVFEKYGDILNHYELPTTRFGISPVGLKHLCRCTIRHSLWKKYELPSGIYKLPIPDILQEYLNLEQD